MIPAFRKLKQIVIANLLRTDNSEPNKPAVLDALSDKKNKKIAKEYGSKEIIQQFRKYFPRSSNKC